MCAHRRRRRHSHTNTAHNHINVGLGALIHTDTNHLQCSTIVRTGLAHVIYSWVSGFCALYSVHATIYSMYNLGVCECAHVGLHVWRNRACAVASDDVADEPPSRALQCGGIVSRSRMWRTSRYTHSRTRAVCWLYVFSDPVATAPIMCVSVCVIVRRWVGNTHELHGGNTMLCCVVGVHHTRTHVSSKHTRASRFYNRLYYMAPQF